MNEWINEWMNEWMRELKKVISWFLVGEIFLEGALYSWGHCDECLTFGPLPYSTLPMGQTEFQAQGRVIAKDCSWIGVLIPGGNGNDKCLLIQEKLDQLISAVFYCCVGEKNLRVLPDLMVTEKLAFGLVGHKSAPICNIGREGPRQRLVEGPQFGRTPWGLVLSSISEGGLAPDH